MFKKNKKRGQSTLEYLVLVAMVIAILIVFLGPTGPFAKAYNNTLQQGTDGMATMANKLAGSHSSPVTP